MDRQRWDIIQAIFAEALDLSREQREPYVRDAADQDEEIVAEVLSLLAAHDAADSMLDGVVMDAIRQESPDDLIGKKVGAFRVVSHIGTGGMGAVYLAERDGDFDQQVALKVLRPGMDTSQVLARFAVERQILARLDHPNIARLYDGGYTDDGIPYFAMEYVDGEPIDEYCDRRQLSVRSRLELFGKACEAVQYAHQNLVVHRDLKPSNILVTDRGSVKLLDFGIAKLLDEGSDNPMLTATGQRVMTPAYAAPEQIVGEPVTTATDVYALGVILYQLLTGRRPFDVARPMHELQQLIVSADPEKPSTVVSQVVAGDLDKNPVTPQDVSRARATPTERLRRILSGDLDNICLKALRKEPGRRYASADQLATDIRRHLDGLPVIARPDTVSYRARKFISRHRAGVAASVVGVAVVTALTAFYTSSLQQERDLARQESLKAEEVSDFLINLFTVPDPEESRGEDVTARELLDSAAVHIRTSLTEQPEVQATLMRVLGETYYGLGLVDRSRNLYELALERQHRIYDRPTSEQATTELLLGIIHQDAGDVETADSLYQLAYTTLVSEKGAGHEDVIESLSLIAFLRETNGDYEAADSLHRMVLAGNERLYPPDHPRVTESMVKLGGLLRARDLPDEAETLLRDALARQERHYGGDHPEIASTLRHLAGIMRNRGDYPAAESTYARMLDIRRRMLGENHIEVAHTLNSLSILYINKGDLEKGLEANEEFLEILQRVYPGDHPSLAAAYYNRASLLRDMDRTDEAVAYFSRSMHVQDAVLAPDHPNRAYPLEALGNLYRSMDRLTESERMLRESLRIRRAALDPGHRYIGDTESGLAATLAARNKFGEAESMQLGAYNGFLSTLGADNNRTRRAARRLADLYDAMGRPDEAATYREKSEVD